MTEFYVDNKIYKKVKYFEIGLCLSLFILGAVLYFISDVGITSELILSVVLIFIGNGIAISWWIQSLYFKKVKSAQQSSKSGSGKQ